MTVMIPSPARLKLPFAAPNRARVTAFAVQAQPLLPTLFVPGLLYFGVSLLRTPALWLGSPLLLVPELLLMVMVLSLSVLALASAPAYLRQWRAGTLDQDARQRQFGLALFAFLAAFTQIAWALMVSAATCPH